MHLLVRLWLLVATMMLLGAVLPAKAADRLKVIYMNINEEGDQSFGYAALDMALQYSGVDYELTVQQQKVNNARVRELLKSGEISISDFGTSAEFEKTFLPVFFPMDFGLNGWRIFLIREDHQPLFDQITTWDDLKAKVAGQGIGWSDIRILENAGIQVVRSAYIDNLINMITFNRFDYFPLGANEAHALLARYQGENDRVLVEKHLLLVYPFARLFFVNKNNPALRDAVYSGLVKAFAAGRLWDLFRQHPTNQALFTVANLKDRRLFKIDNPDMTAAFREMPSDYFFRLDWLNQ